MTGRVKRGKVKVGLTKADLQQIRATLISRRKELQAKLGLPVENCGSESDLNCRANDETEVHLDLTLRGLWQEELKRIKVVLRAIKLGKYGICQNCGEPIDRKRLLAYPLVTHCLECKEAMEGARYPRGQSYSAI
jgi:DnaK suppressor protein